MRFLPFVCATAVLLLLTGCTDLLSVHPLATAETAVFDESLTGEWACADKDCKGSVLIRAGSAANKDYDIIWIPGEDDDEPLRLKGQLVKVGDRLVFDLVTTRRPDMAVPGHFFMLVDKTAGTAKFHWLDSEWLRNQVISRKSLPYTMVNDKPVIRAGSAEINAFLAQYGLDARAVSDTLSFKRAKPL
jgi:hypothetical protein